MIRQRSLFTLHFLTLMLNFQRRGMCPIVGVAKNNNDFCTVGKDLGGNQCCQPMHAKMTFDLY